MLLIPLISQAVPWYLKECLEVAVDAKIAIKNAEKYTGKVYKLYLTRRSSGECLYKIKGEKGTAVVDALTGKVVKFFKSE